MGGVGLLSKRRDKLYITVDGFTIDKINELLETGDFNSVSALVRTAILYLYKDYEAKGKLKPKSVRRGLKEDPEQLSPDEEPIFREDVSL